MKNFKWFLIMVSFLSARAHAYKEGEIFIDPHVGIGFNVAQGTAFMAGVDVGYAFTEQIAGGMTIFGSAGERPQHDRTLGAGPFATFFHPFTTFLIGHVREEIAYIDQRNPYERTDAAGATSWTHSNETGVASITSIGMHVILTSNLGVSGGYRVVLPLSNADLDNGRSGVFLGASIGF